MSTKRYIRHGETDRGIPPVKVGGVATAAAPADVDEGDLVQASFDLAGQLRTTASVTAPEPLSVDDNGGSLTVDGSVSITDGSSTATVRNLTANDALNVAIVDGSGDQITSFGGGTQYTEGATDASITGTAVMWEDTGDTLRVASAAKPLPVDGSGVTQPVSGTFWQATQPVSGTVTVQDGGGSLTVDGTVGVSGSVAVTGTFWQATQPVSAASLPLPSGAATAALQTQPGIDIGDVTVNNASGASAVNIQDGGNAITVDGTVTASNAAGDVAHDGVDSGNPVKVGLKAIAHGTNPTAVAVADRTNWFANRHGIPFVMNGHPNVIALRANYTTAQTNVALVTVGAGAKIVVTRASALADGANTVDVAVRIGFGASTTPTTTGVVLSHPGIVPGSGVIEGTGSGMLGVGADGEDLRITSQVSTGGSIDVMLTYYTIES